MKADYDLAGRVIGLAMKVHTALGPGFLESVYHQALKHELTQARLRFESERAIDVQYDGVIVELKAVQTLAIAHEVQTVNYPTATGKDTGLLLNFGSDRLEFKKKFRQINPKSAINEISF